MGKTNVPMSNDCGEDGEVVGPEPAGPRLPAKRERPDSGNDSDVDSDDRSGEGTRGAARRRPRIDREAFDSGKSAGPKPEVAPTAAGEPVRVPEASAAVAPAPKSFADRMGGA
ncbi:hypothetical protein HK405_002727, partial [Cladochytrium tenue]